jgi:hypothetical protein
VFWFDLKRSHQSNATAPKKKKPGDLSDAGQTALGGEIDDDYLSHYLLSKRRANYPIQ